MKYRFKAWGYKNKETGEWAMHRDLGGPVMEGSRSAARDFKSDSEKLVRFDVTMEVKECGG